MIERKELFRTDVDIRWGDMDALGQVNSAAYFRYMEEVRVRWLLSIDKKIMPGEVGPVLINSSATYLKPIYYPADVYCVLFADPPGRSSCNLHYEFYFHGAEQQVTVAESKMIWTDYQAGKSVPIPDDLRQHLV